MNQATGNNSQAGFDVGFALAKHARAKYIISVYEVCTCLFTVLSHLMRWLELFYGFQ